MPSPTVKLAATCIATGALNRYATKPRDGSEASVT
jgi:hypothetical protein